jgi:methionyl-tRNA synthetase
MSWELTALVFLVIVELIWKAIGLWAAAKKNDRLWFIIMFLFNTAGILPIIYLKFNTDFFGAKKKTKKRR